MREGEFDLWTRLTGVVLVVGFAGGLAALLGSRGGLVADDFVNVRIAQTEGLSLGYLARPVLLQFAPGHKLVSWVVSAAAPPLSYLPVRALTVVLFAALVWVMYRVLASLFGERPMVLLLAAVFGASVVQTGTAVWFSGALHRLPGVLFCLASFLAYLRFRRDGNPLVLAASVVVLGVAFAFMVQVAAVMLFLLVVHALVVQRDRDPLEELRQEAPRWAWYLLPASAALAGYLIQLGGTLRVSSASEAFEYLVVSWFQVFVPAVFGAFPGEDAFSAFDGALVALSQAALAAVVVVSLLRRRGAWKAWAAFAAGFAVTEGLVATTRVAGLDPSEVAFAMRYHVEALAMFVVAAGAAFGGPPDPGAKPVPAAGPLQGHQALAVSMAVILAFAAASTVNAFRYTEGWYAVESRPYVENLRHDLAALTEAGRRMSLVDGTVPHEVVIRELPQYNRLSEVVPLLEGDVDFSLHGDRLFRVTPEGELEPARYRRLAGGQAAQLYESELLVVEPGRSVSTEDGRLCAGTRTEGSVFNFAPPGRLPEGDVYASFTYRAAGDAFASIVYGTGADVERAQDPFVELDGGRGELVVEVGREPFEYVSVILPSGTKVCMDEIELGLVDGEP